MDKELFKKVIGEQPLTVEEALRLDGALESEKSVLISKMVAGLEDDAPSLVWRSALNSKLEAASRKRRTAVVWRFGLAASAVAAGSFLIVGLLRPVEKDAPRVMTADNEVSVEEAILGEHEYATGQASLGVHVSFDSGS